MDKNLFFYELEGRGYIFQNKKWDEAKHVFEDDMLNMAWEMWSSAKHSVKAQAVPEYAEFYLGGGVFAICDWKDYETVKTSNGILVAVNLELNGYGLMTLKMQT